MLFLKKKLMPKLLIIGYVWPEPESSAAGTRMMQLIKHFQNENYDITFATTAKESDNKTDLRSLGIQEEKIKLNHPEFDVFLQNLMPEIVIFDRFMMEEQFGWRVDAVCPEAIKILDTEDLHFLRDVRQKSFKENKPVEDFYFDSDLAKREIAAIYRCDLSLIISEVELKLLISEFSVPGDILLYLPFLLEEISENSSDTLPDYESRQDFISIGNFLHEPNWSAVLYLKERIWPEIRKQLPKANMNIYGAYPGQKVLNLHNPKEKFLVHGWAEDSQIVMKNSSVCLAPIQFGAGLKGKLIEAMQCGTPSITTSVGAEGMNADLAWNGFISDSDDDFINKAVELYSDKELWNTKQQNGFEIINKRFSKSLHTRRLKTAIKDLKENLRDHRNKNFTGKMLKHHLHKSTYFMSRFIEEKNRNKN